MSYRLSTVVKPLIWIETVSLLKNFVFYLFFKVIERFSHSRIEYMIKVYVYFKPFLGGGGGIIQKKIADSICRFFSI